MAEKNYVARVLECTQALNSLQFALKQRLIDPDVYARFLWLIKRQIGDIMSETEHQFLLWKTVELEKVKGLKEIK